MRIVRNVLAGALSGAGVVVLLQQYAVLYPTGTVAILGVVIGIAVQLGIAAGFRPNRIAAAPAIAPHSPAIAAHVPDASAASDGGPGVTGWTPTHLVPAEGLDTWPDRDLTQEPGPRLDGGLEVRVDDVGDGWAHVVCENGWAAWVDAGRLEERP